MVAEWSSLEVAEDHLPEVVSEDSPPGSGAVGGILTPGGVAQVLESTLV